MLCFQKQLFLYRCIVRMLWERRSGCSSRNFCEFAHEKTNKFHTIQITAYSCGQLYSSFSVCLSLWRYSVEGLSALLHSEANERILRERLLLLSDLSHRNWARTRNFTFNCPTPRVTNKPWPWFYNTFPRSFLWQ